MDIQISIRHMIASLVNKKMVLELCGEINNKYKSVNIIDIKIEDINGPNKSGIDKRCHLKVRGKNNLMFDIDDIDTEIDCAIDNSFYHLNLALEKYSCIRNQHLNNTTYGNNSINRCLR
jgi:hypothetical protein